MSATEPTATEPTCLWRSPLLGEPRELELTQGRLQYFVRGEGPPIVFCHGWLANANLWRDIVNSLAADHQCFAFDLPLGSHRVAMNENADLSPDGCGALIADALAALELSDVTLVGNDSGGAYSQIAVATQPGRVARLVLNSCETPYDEFPPPPFDGLPAAARDVETLGTLLGALRDPAVRVTPPAYGLLIKHPIEPAVSDSYALPCLYDAGVLSDTSKVMSSAQSAPVHAAGKKLIAEFERPVLFAWGTEDQVFPIAHAERYAEQLRDGRVEPIADAYSFTPEDQPEALATAIARFVAG
ncbi:MAG TPA: alpha/beta hydrolase [Solirubrobacteraceae bacterium]|jgi:pimeloyl-ACP methyl ester carboxylesterase